MPSTPCNPAVNGMTTARVDSLLFSILPSKVNFVKDEWCDNCNMVDECLKLGTWYDVDGLPHVTEGIYGGMTQIERQNDLTYPLSVW